MYTFHIIVAVVFKVFRGKYFRVIALNRFINWKKFRNLTKRANHIVPGGTSVCTL
jgi:hypothetical protein